MGFSFPILNFPFQHSSSACMDTNWYDIPWLVFPHHDIFDRGLIVMHKKAIRTKVPSDEVEITLFVNFTNASFTNDDAHGPIVVTTILPSFPLTRLFLHEQYDGSTCWAGSSYPSRAHAIIIRHSMFSAIGVKVGVPVIKTIKDYQFTHCLLNICIYCLKAFGNSPYWSWTVS